MTQTWTRYGLWPACKCGKGDNGVGHGQGRATVIGSIAFVMWATLALLTAQTGQVPPFLLVGLSFTLAFAIGFVFWLSEPSGGGSLTARVLSQIGLPFPAWVLGVGGLFGYHFFYFAALRNAPPVEASLIAYLWPLLIVLFSAFLPGERLRWWHVTGTVAGLFGTAVLVTGGDISFKTEFALGYAAAVVCALTWSGYSVLSRTVRHISSTAVGAFCGVTAVLSFAAHFAFETTVWPDGAGEWLAVLGLGLGPVGAAFYLWDHGVKQGDIRVLGAASYGAPLLSTILLIAVGLAEATWQVGLASLLITGGGLLAARDLLRSGRTEGIPPRDGPAGAG